MRPRRLFTPRDTAAIFDQAVSERALAVLTYQDGIDWQTFKCRFLERDAKGRFFVLDYQQGDVGEPLPPLTAGQYVGVSFRQRSRKILLSTVVEARGHYLLEDQTSVPAIRYRWPSSLTELQRRSYHRTPVPRDLNLVASLWAGGIAARANAQAATLAVVTGDIADLSCGGTMIWLHQGQAPRWADDELLGLELQMPDGRAPIVVDARYRGLRYGENGVIGIAIQFVGLEVTIDGRAVLERLAQGVQQLNRMQFAPVRGRTQPPNGE